MLGLASLSFPPGLLCLPSLASLGLAWTPGSPPGLSVAILVCLRVPVVFPVAALDTATYTRLVTRQKCQHVPPWTGAQAPASHSGLFKAFRTGWLA